VIEKKEEAIRWIKGTARGAMRKLLKIRKEETGEITTFG
jgi:hypothetical protein